MFINKPNKFSVFNIKIIYL